MALKIYTSNRIEKLAAFFSEKMLGRSSWNETAQVVVQTPGIEKWLIKHTAHKNKIFANYAFSNPDIFIGKIQKLVGIYGNNYFSMDNIKWKMFAYLNDAEFIEQFPSISKYYFEDDVKRVQLAQKLSDLFDQYQMFRPELVNLWNNDEEMKTVSDAVFNEHSTWQKWLWRKLKSESGQKPDAIQRKQELLSKLETEEFQLLLKKHFPTLHLFGIAVLSNNYWEIYKKLSKVIDVYIYSTSPSVGIQKTSSTTKNELLSSCNRLMLTLQNHLPVENTVSLPVEPKGKSLLSALQRDIYFNSNENIRNFERISGDDSVRIASSYTPVREVEALYNDLLNRLENNPELKPEDVSIQLTNVNLYAPLIKAVFDNAPKRIPYIITDQSFSEGDSVIKALHVFFSLHHSNFKAENVLQLLEFKGVRKCFGIDDVDFVRQIISDANIRYGTEGNQEEETYLYSWTHGLNKLILGYAIKGGQEYIKDGTAYYPCDAIEGTEALNVFKIKAFTDTLFRLHQGTKGLKTIVDWKEFLLNKVLVELFDLESDFYNEELDSIHKKLEGLSNSTIEMREEISFQLFQEGLISLLNSETENNLYTSGLVTFSSIIPVRSIPYKYIAILGLNAGEFPRQLKTLGFDLMAIAPKENDRNIKDNDKFLFLEALLSARDSIYLSYIGSSIKDNSELPPSLLIEELKEYLITGTGNEEWYKEKIQYNHPLHLSSKVYFEGK